MFFSLGCAGRLVQASTSVFRREPDAEELDSAVQQV